MRAPVSAVFAVPSVTAVTPVSALSSVTVVCSALGVSGDSSAGTDPENLQGEWLTTVM